MKKGVLFDLDGTLWDALDTTVESANIIAKKYNQMCISKDTIRGCMGKTRLECAKEYFPNLPEDEALQYNLEISDINIKNLSKYGAYNYPKIKEVLAILKEQGYILYIVSNTSHTEYIESFINTSNAGYLFDGWLASGSIKLSKADAIKKVIEDNEIEKAIYVGDTKVDQDAATEAGIPFVYASYGFGKDVKSDHKIDTFYDLIDVVNNILNKNV